MTAAFLSVPLTLFVSLVTAFTFDWRSDGMRFQISPEFIFARSSDFSQPSHLGRSLTPNPHKISRAE